MRKHARQGAVFTSQEIKLVAEVKYVSTGVKEKGVLFHDPVSVPSAVTKV